MHLKRRDATEGQRGVKNNEKNLTGSHIALGSDGPGPHLHSAFAPGVPVYLHTKGLGRVRRT